MVVLYVNQFVCWEENNNVHIGNHLYFENQKRWGTKPDDLSEVFYSQGTSLPNKNPDDCQTCFYFILQYSVINLKMKNELAPSLNCQTSTSSIQDRAFK